MPTTTLALGAESPVVLVDEGGQGRNRCNPVLGVGEIPGSLNGEVSGAAAERRVNDREQPTRVVRHGDPLPTYLTDEFVVGMAGNHQIHCLIQPCGDLRNRAVKTGPAVVLTAVGEAALVKKDHYCLDSLLLEPGDKGVDRIGLIKERQPRHSAAGDDVGSSLQGEAYERHLDALELADCVGWKYGAPGPVVNDVGGQKLEVGALEGFAIDVVSLEGVGPPCCILNNSAGPSSNSWLPTPLKSSPMRFIASMVGSSWKRAEIRGDAPMRSPAETNTEFSAPALAAAMLAAR